MYFVISAKFYEEKFRKYSISNKYFFGEKYEMLFELQSWKKKTHEENLLSFGVCHIRVVCNFQQQP